MTRHFLAVLVVIIAGSVYADSASAQAPYGPYVQSRVPRMASGYPMPGRMNYPLATQTRRIPQFNASLYPCPQQGIPVQVGGTMLTNQAFAPHELLHAHEYRAMYPPYYYRVKGHWLWTPFGIESHDRWELSGTEVKVKYRTSYNPLAAFFPRATN